MQGVAICCKLVQVRLSCGWPATCETSLIHTNREWPISLRAPTLYAMRECRRNASSITNRARARRDGDANGFSMFIDILTREAIDSLSRLRAKSTVEHPSNERCDSDERIGQEGPRPERDPDRAP